MHPVLFEIGGFAVGTYALFALAGLVAGVALFAWLGAREGHDRWLFVEMGLWAFIIAITASKAFAVVVDFDPSAPWESIVQAVRFAGHYWVGFLAGSTYLLIDLRRRGVGIGPGLDALAPALALAHGLGRIGCFFAGCCYGTACEAPWAVTFPSNEITDVPVGVPLHPTQLYEAGVELVLCVVLLVAHLRWRRFAGQTFGTYVLLYGVARFILEEFRADDRGVLVLGLSTTQALLLPTMAAAAAVMVVLWRRSDGTPRSRPAKPAGTGPANPAGTGPAKPAAAAAPFRERTTRRERRRKRRRRGP